MRQPRFGIRTMMVVVAMTALALSAALRYPVLLVYLVLPIGWALVWTIISAHQWQHHERVKALAQAFDYFTGAALRFALTAGIATLLFVVVMCYLIYSVPFATHR